MIGDRGILFIPAPKAVDWSLKMDTNVDFEDRGWDELKKVFSCPHGRDFSNNVF
jgi:hypothetical protein